MPQPVKNTNLPLVTFLSPCYNHEKYIIQSLESIRNQTYQNIQHIIIDDASTDGSLKLIEEWIAKNNYNCKLIKHTSNKGISAALNESIKLCDGMYWTVCSTDDCVHPERTQIFVDYLQENPGISMVVSDMGMIDDAGRELHLNNTSSFVRNRTLLHPNFSIDTFGTYQSLLFDNYIPGSLMIARQVFEEVGLFNESIQMEDWDMWLRISLKYKIGFINRILAYYRWHDTNAVKLTPVKMRKSMFTTFFNQKKICYTGNKKELFENAYVHHFINYYNPVKYPATSVSFHQIRLPVYVKALRTKIIKMTKALFTQKN